MPYNKFESSIPVDLPVPFDHRLPYTLSLVVAGIVFVTSLGGLLFPVNIYPNSEMLQTYVTNDVVNLFIGLPSLLLSIWFTRRGKLFSLLLWPGALLYTLYNYIAYIFGNSISVFTLVYIVLVLLSTYALFILMRSLDANAVQKQITGLVAEKFCGGVLILFGIAFFFRAIGMIASASLNQIPLPTSDFSVLLADIVLSVLWVIGGTTLLLQRAFGYISGLGLLFSGCTLFIGLIFFLLLQPLISNNPGYAFIDIVVVSVMGLICFVPFGLFVRGVLSIKSI